VFLDDLKLLLTYIGVSDCNMQEGSLRVDANVNLHVAANGGNVATPIVEVKNLNSFRAVERALAYEAKRQLLAWQETGRRLGEAPKETRGWDDEAGVTRGQRSKEESSDYRYFPDPDLVPVTVSAAMEDEVRASLGELPSALRRRLQSEYGLSFYDADVLVHQGRPLADFFLAVADAVGDGKAAANWVTQDVLRTLKDEGITIDRFPLSSTALAELVRHVRDGKLPSARSREVFDQMVASGETVGQVMSALGIATVDEGELMALCQDLLAENPQIVADVRSGKTKAIGALIGQAKKRNSNADPTLVRETVLALIARM
jgi:aspartyl-tRNA(Asn)/glutamyl-tRNA(Gln) amidotransferase subunit B